ncbi:MAG: hypothetical protein H0T89_20155 [Deltaproteobacteria bacterium]|nr:hypothetical protein [Deltaproteobacteria bacterium]MDQ3298427.1 hypothetical protein [Myxococcota bacterium]
MVSAGGRHTCAVGVDGGLACWGRDERGALGLASELGASMQTPQRVVSDETWATVAAGAAHTCAITVDGELHCTGSNMHGELGAGTTGQQLTPQRVEGAFTSVSTGENHTCGVRDGALWCWGSNVGGQLADPSLLARQRPVLAVASATASAAGHDQSCALDGSALACWGGDELGDVGNGAAGATAVPFAITAPSAAWIAVDAREHTCAIDSGNVAYCWGSNARGKLGDPNLGTTSLVDSPHLVDGPTRYTSISTGGNHTCAIEQTTSNVFCWGQNNTGQLGDGSEVTRAAPAAVETSGAIATYAASTITTGYLHTCAIQADAALACWGFNSDGQLGIGNTTSRRFPAKLDRTWRAVTAGTRHTCGIDTAGQLACWGANDLGQLGDGSTVGRAVPTPIRADLRWKAVDAHGAHTCAITEDDALYCWGSNLQGQLGDGTAWRTSFAPVLP